MTDKPKMAVQAGAPAGVETDENGNLIPFEQRTPEDQEAVQEAIANALHPEAKDPDGEALAPSAMPRHQQGQGEAPRKDDLAGNQGGQQGGGPNKVQHH